jgi:hypothetical protein
MALLAWAFTLVVIWLATRLRAEGPRALRLTSYFALLNLAALRSPAAPSAYVVVPALWMLALLASDGRGRTWWPWVIALLWLIIAGAPPLPNTIDLVVAGFGQATMVAACIWGIVRRSAVGAAQTDLTETLSPRVPRTVS